jgi:hypothetical protein
MMLRSGKSYSYEAKTMKTNKCAHSECECEENELFDRKFPDASCETCEKKVTGATVVFCGDGCETWFCMECWKGVGCCSICVSMNGKEKFEFCQCGLSGDECECVMCDDCGCAHEDSKNSCHQGECYTCGVQIFGLEEGWGYNEDDELECENCYEDPDKWENDELCLELNWGNCIMEGRHKNTSDEDWALFCEAADAPYSEELYNKLQTRLKERRGI